MANKRLSLDQIKNFPIETLSSLEGAELRKVVADASRLANQRLRRLAAKGYDEDLSPAYESAVRKGHERFNIRGMGDMALRNEFTEIREFLKMRSSTVIGTKQMHAEVYRRIGGDFSDDIEKEKAFWRAFRTAEKKQDRAFSSKGSEELQQFVYQTFEPDQYEDILNTVNQNRSDYLDDYELSEEVESMYDYDELFDDYGNPDINFLNEHDLVIDDKGKIHHLGDSTDDRLFLLSQFGVVNLELEEGERNAGKTWRSLD